MLERIDHEFVEYVPEALSPGVLYVSMDYATASHLCCCGCGEKVVTPFTPTDWRITYDGETVTLHPSVGNWEQGCRTHYVIDHGRVVVHGGWTREEVEAERIRDRTEKRRHYGVASPTSVVAEGRPAPGFWSKFKSLFKRS